jgi:hypothetical protein
LARAPEVDLLGRYLLGGKRHHASEEQKEKVSGVHGMAPQARSEVKKVGCVRPVSAQAVEA